MKNIKKNSKAPILGPAERVDQNGEAVFDLTNSTSATECTGLIKTPPQNQDELENYNKVYNFTITEPLPEKED